MILSALRDYIRQQVHATLADIALHFDAEPTALRGMLDVLIDKGKVRKTSLTTSCGSNCNRCDPASTEIYVWCEADSDGRSPSPTDCARR